MSADGVGCGTGADGCWHHELSYASLESTDSGYTQQPWLPDELVTKCMLCQQPFGMWRWSHHCRDCGGCFCRECTRHRVDSLSKDGPATLRLCDRCAFSSAHPEHLGCECAPTTTLPPCQLPALHGPLTRCRMLIGARCNARGARCLEPSGNYASTCFWSYESPPVASARPAPHALQAAEAAHPLPRHKAPRRRPCPQRHPYCKLCMLPRRRRSITFLRHNGAELSSRAACLVLRVMVLDLELVLVLLRASGA